MGRYRKGVERHPVAGASWFEAAAYAEFVGKSLPTVYHWTLASQALWFPALFASGGNFGGDTTQPVGERGTSSGFGTTDMAGNVKEWCWNERGDIKRYIMGGGFAEPDYMFVYTDAELPWARRPNFGFRCAKIDSTTPEIAMATISPFYRDYSSETPVSDEVFRAFRGLYEYDKGELNVELEQTETADSWTWEQVSFDAAYGSERVTVHVYIPNNASPPFQAVVFFPGAGALFRDEFARTMIEDWDIDFFVKSGRALVWPIFKGTFERRDGLVPYAPNGVVRDHMIMFSKDLGRTVDYLDTREDIDSARTAFVGFSYGALRGPILLAVESRFEAAILSGGGLVHWYFLPEADPFNFAGRVRAPVLMLNGRFDEFFHSTLPRFLSLNCSARPMRTRSTLSSTPAMAAT